MELLVESLALLLGMVLSVPAARLALAGVLRLTFGRGRG